MLVDDVQHTEAHLLGCHHGTREHAINEGCSVEEQEINIGHDHAGDRLTSVQNHQER